MVTGRGLLSSLVLFPLLLVSALAGAQTAVLQGAAYFDLLQQARAAARAGDHATALAAWRRLSEATPDHGEVLLGLAESAIATGDFPAALQAGERVLQIGDRRVAGLAYRMATAYARAGRREDVLRLLAHALEHGWEDRSRLSAEPAFAAWQEDPAFRELAGAVRTDDIDRSRGWQEDLRIFLAEAQRLHAAPRSIARTQEYAEAVAALQERVAEMDDVAVLVELERLVARLGDGHSQVRGRGGERVHTSALERTLPLRFHAFADGPRVVAATPEHAGLVGARLLSLGGLAIEEAVAGIAPWLSRDNDTWLWSYGLEALLVRPVYLTAAGAIGDAEEAVRVGLEIDGERREVTLEALPGLDLPGWPMPAGAEAAAPLLLRTRDRLHTLERLADPDAAYLIVHAIEDPQPGAGPTLGDHAAEIRRWVTQEAIDTVIVDLRLNGGGNSRLLESLVRTLVWFDQEDPQHRLFVVTGPRTFSAAQNLANRLEALTDAIFVGRPTGSRPNFPGEVSRVLLPWSGVQVSVASRYWQDSDPLDERPWIFPDVPVAMTWEDWRSNRDPALAAIATILRQR